MEWFEPVADIQPCGRQVFDLLATDGRFWTRNCDARYLAVVGPSVKLFQSLSDGSPGCGKPRRSAFCA
ncbi:MAG: hypothetical protein KatS3mg110_3292 [Pirellulaceae bacterium]|nr:MAG: hypothetical protein KatS3mg110_3292 [Pirellulaceae bacterium]